MSDTQYAEAIGLIQQFGKDKPAVERKQLNDGQTVTRFTIKTGSGALIGVTLWPEFDHVLPHLQRGALVGVSGKYSSNTNQNTGVVYHSISANTLALGPAIQKAERPVVNAQPAQAAPVAQAAVAPVAEAPVAAPVPGSNLTF